MIYGLRRVACTLSMIAAVCVPATATPEAVWLRIANGAGGSIKVRLGETGEWATLGRVLRPATRTAPGFGAARWAIPGTVAATAVHGIRVRIADGEFGPMFSLVPRQFSTTPALYGGHVPGDSGIRTDIGAGETLFREWAPVTDSPVFLETAAGPMPLPNDYVPTPGDVILIRSQWRSDAPSLITFGNRKGGAITATDTENRITRLGTVTQPLLGVGRFDGTSYTGVGAINTNHPGVITVSTAPFVASDLSEGAPPERRGGFEISPAIHVKDQAEGSPQVMGIAPNPGDPGWEGRFPLFSGALALWQGVTGYIGFHVEMQVDHGTWEPLPQMVGRDDNAFSAKGLVKYLPSRDAIREGVTAFRIFLPRWDDAQAEQRFQAALKAQPTLGKEPTGVYQAVKGRVSLVAKGPIKTITYILDGAVRAAGNSPGYIWGWDTTKERNGRHWLEIRRELRDGAVRSEVRRLFIQNGA